MVSDMAIVACYPYLYKAGWQIEYFNSFASAGTVTLDSDTEYYCYHFIAPETETLDKAEFRIASVTTAGDIEVSIVTINTADCAPDTLVGTEISLNITASGAYEVTGLSAAVTAGTRYGLRFMVDSGVNLGFQHSWGGSEQGGDGTAIAVTNTSGSVARAGYSGRGATVGLGTTSGYKVINPRWSGAVAALSTTTINETGTDFCGNKIIMPYKCRIGGLWHVIQGTISANRSAVLANSSGTILASFDGSSSNSTVGSGAWGLAMFDSDVAVTVDVNAGDTIYALAQQTTNFNHNIYYADFRSNASLGSWWGTSSFGVTGSTLGTWTEHDTRIYGVFPIIVGVDDGAGAASSSVFVTRPSTLLRR